METFIKKLTTELTMRSARIQKWNVARMQSNEGEGVLERG